MNLRNAIEHCIQEYRQNYSLFNYVFGDEEYIEDLAKCVKYERMEYAQVVDLILVQYEHRTNPQLRTGAGKAGRIYVRLEQKLKEFVPEDFLTETTYKLNNLYSKADKKKFLYALFSSLDKIKRNNQSDSVRIYEQFKFLIAFIFHYTMDGHNDVVYMNGHNDVENIYFFLEAFVLSKNKAHFAKHCLYLVLLKPHRIREDTLLKLLEKKPNELALISNIINQLGRITQLSINFLQIRDLDLLISLNEADLKKLIELIGIMQRLEGVKDFKKMIKDTLSFSIILVLVGRFNIKVFSDNPLFQCTVHSTDSIFENNQIPIDDKIKLLELINTSYSHFLLGNYFKNIEEFDKAYHHFEEANDYLPAQKELLPFYISQSLNDDNEIDNPHAYAAAISTAASIINNEPNYYEAVAFLQSDQTYGTSSTIREEFIAIADRPIRSSVFCMRGNNNFIAQLKLGFLHENRTKNAEIQHEFDQNYGLSLWVMPTPKP